MLIAVMHRELIYGVKNQVTRRFCECTILFEDCGVRSWRYHWLFSRLESILGTYILDNMAAKVALMTRSKIFTTCQMTESGIT